MCFLLGSHRTYLFHLPRAVFGEVLSERLQLEQRKATGLPLPTGCTTGRGALLKGERKASTSHLAQLREQRRSVACGEPQSEQESPKIRRWTLDFCSEMMDQGRVFLINHRGICRILCHPETTTVAAPGTTKGKDRFCKDTVGKGENHSRKSILICLMARL